jgi:hypothetical protein
MHRNNFTGFAFTPLFSASEPEISTEWKIERGCMDLLHMQETGNVNPWLHAEYDPCINRGYVDTGTAPY